jgi:hypothetical protein
MDSDPIARPPQLSAAAGPLRIETVEGWRGKTRFLRVPWHVYENDPQWRPPLLLERREHLSRRNPFFRHSNARFWIAYRGDRAVGRITAQVDDLHLQTYQDHTGFFGFLEAVDDPAVFQALFATAEAWLREQGMRRSLGPFSFSINDECGTLIDGFDTPPMFMMPHGLPYYDARLIEQGYRKAMDTVACILDPAIAPPPVMAATVRKALAGPVRVRPIRLSHLREDILLLRDIFNDAWSDNWNFVPFTIDELAALGSSLKLFVPADFVLIAEVEGRPAAMLVATPNLNETIRDLNGALLPFGWARLLWRLKRRLPSSARVPLMGVRREYHRSTLGMTLVFCLFDAIRRNMIAHGVNQLELSWVLEDNRPMRRIMERVGGRTYKRYRMYEKPLA